KEQLHIFSGGDASQQYDPTVLRQGSRQCGKVRKKRLAVFRVVDVDRDCSKRVEVVEGGVSRTSRQPPGPGNHQRFDWAVGRPTEPLRICQLPPEVEPADQREDLPERGTRCNPDPLRQVEHGCGPEERGGTSATAMCGGEEEDRRR